MSNLRYFRLGFVRVVLILTGILVFGVAAATVNAGNQNQELRKAAMAGDVRKVERLLQEGASVNAKSRDGFTALMLASLTNRLAIVKLLLQKGVDVNARTSHGVTALMLASAKGGIEIVRLLLEAGADVNAREETSGWTALTHATRNGHQNIRKILLEHGAKK